MNLIQFNTREGGRAVALIEKDQALTVKDTHTVYELAQAAISARRTLRAEADSRGFGAAVDVAAIVADGRLLPPIDHPDPAHLYVTGTGLTHLGSAATRDSMHKSAAEAADAPMTDSMKMFRMGLEGGKPQNGEKGVQPEWFYKGNGHAVVAPGHAIPSPSFAEDAGEEPEIAGIYIVGPDGQPRRLGFAIANEFSDHVTERVNYLFLAHSKLRACSFGPELLVGDLSKDIAGTSRIVRDGETLWEKPFLSGEDNMSHTIANLEYHHFKYDLFRNPGDIHVHMFGTATLSFADNVTTKDGDVFEISAPAFGLPLKNAIAGVPEHELKIAPLY